MHMSRGRMCPKSRMSQSQANNLHSAQLPSQDRKTVTACFHKGICISAEGSCTSNLRWSYLHGLFERNLYLTLLSVEYLHPMRNAS